MAIVFVSLHDPLAPRQNTSRVCAHTVPGPLFPSVVRWYCGGGRDPCTAAAHAAPSAVTVSLPNLCREVVTAAAGARSRFDSPCSTATISMSSSPAGRGGAEGGAGSSVASRTNTSSSVDAVMP